MRRTYTLLLIFLTLMGCNFFKTSKKLTVKQFRYSTYSWHYSVDSAAFYLATYLEARPDGSYHVMRHDTFMGVPQYIEGQLSDSISAYIDTAIMGKIFQPVYFFKPGSAVLYDGFTYCLDYRNEQNSRTIVQYIPEESPHQLQRLSLMLDTIVYNNRAKKIQPFKIDPYKDSLGYLARKYGPRVLSPTKQPSVIIK